MSNASISNKIQFVYYLGSGININNISSGTLSNINNIIGIGSDGVNPQSWGNGFPFNSLIYLDNNQGYLVSSKNSASLPYNLYSENDSVITGVVLNKKVQIAEYRGSSKDLSTDSISLNFDSVIGIDSNGNPQSWTNGFPFNSLSSISSGNTYLFYNKTGNLPFALWPNDTVTLTPTPTPTHTPTPTPTPVPSTTGNFTMYGWGDNSYGQISPIVFSIAKYLFPISNVQNTNNRTWSQVAVYGNTSIALDSYGHLYGWGNNPYGIIGTQPQYNSPARINNDIFKKIALGNSTAIGIRSDGVLCYLNGFSSTPISLSTDWIDIAIGGGTIDTYFAINSANNLYAWGNYASLLGNGSTYGKIITPTQIGKSNSWEKISVGFDHVLGITTDGKLYGWGINDSAQVGDGTIGTNRLIPTKITTKNNWIDIAAGYKFSMALNSNGEIYIWGSNESRIISGYSYNINFLNPRKLGITNNWIKIFAANDTIGSAAAINSDHELYTWGYNNLGNFNLKDGTPSSVPHRVGSFANWFDASINTNHSLGLASGVPSAVNNSGLFAFGDNTNGQLGYGVVNEYGHTTHFNYPLKIDLVDDWTDISSSVNSSTVAIRNNELYGCGRTNTLTSGIYDLSNLQAYATIDSLSSFQKFPDYAGSSWSGVSCGGTSTFVINNSGELYGITNKPNTSALTYSNHDFYKIPATIITGIINNFTVSGINDINNTPVNTNIPIDVSFGNEYHVTATGLVSVGLGLVGPDAPVYGRLIGKVKNNNSYILYGPDDYIFYLGKDYTISSISPYWNPANTGVLCLGVDDASGQFSNNSGQFSVTVETKKLVPISGSSWTQIEASQDHQLGIYNNNLYVWGNNNYNQLGLPNTSIVYPIPVPVTGVSSSWLKVASNNSLYSSAAIDHLNKLYVCGYNGDGQLGLGDKINKTSWTLNSFNNLTWKDISLGYNHTLGVTTDGYLYSWGSNTYGQLGDETFTNRLVPTLIGSKNDWIKVMAGQYCGFAIDSTGQVYSWGKNDIGQSGGGSISAFNIPTKMYINNEDGSTTYLDNCTKVLCRGNSGFILRNAV